MDPNTAANYTEIKLTHCNFNWLVDFQARQLKGDVSINLLALIDGVQKIILDTSCLNIDSVSVDGEASLYELLPYNNIKFSAPLAISLKKALTAGDQIAVKVTYSTSSNPSKATALQWIVAKEELINGKPCVYTQCQPIHARSLFPCQDTPAVKFTYEAQVSCSCSEVTALMSASRLPQLSGAFCFRQEIVTPSYLVALAVGSIYSREVSLQMTVWSDKDIDVIASDFQTAPRFIEAAEYLTGVKYPWSTLDLLVLPQSFPFGGMENTQLTFLTPSIVTGDGSLVDVVAHEISHSWAGNSVGCSSWESFWLNEGWCVYLERRVLALDSQNQHNEDVRQFDALIGWRALSESIETMSKNNALNLTCLVNDLNGVDPDDAFSSVPYEKGFNLLYHLECLLTRNVFDQYIKEYFKYFQHQAINTEQWKAHLYDYISSHYPQCLGVLSQVDWKAWLYGVGMPPVQLPFKTELANICLQHAQMILLTDVDCDIVSQNFDTQQMILFLDQFLGNAVKVLSHDVLLKLGEAYGLGYGTVSKTSLSKRQWLLNSEIRHRWYLICLKAKYEPVFEGVSQFLASYGRMKFVRTLMRALDQCSPAGRSVAIDALHSNRYHPICASMVRKDLKLPDNS